MIKITKIQLLKLVNTLYVNKRTGIREKKIKKAGKLIAKNGTTKFTSAKIFFGVENSCGKFLAGYNHDMKKPLTFKQWQTLLKTNIHLVVIHKILTSINTRTLQTYKLAKILIMILE